MSNPLIRWWLMSSDRQSVLVLYQCCTKAANLDLVSFQQKTSRVTMTSWPRYVEQKAPKITTASASLDTSTSQLGASRINERIYSRFLFLWPFKFKMVFGFVNAFILLKLLTYSIFIPIILHAPVLGSKGTFHHTIALNYCFKY
jgi:hypothetical protein